MPSHAHDWRRASNCAAYRRRLGNTELGFYWDSVFHGTAVTIYHLEVDAEQESEHALFSDANVTRAWLRMKQRFPLLGASIDEIADSDVVEFVVDEESLRVPRPNEIHQIEIDDADGIAKLTEELLNGPSPLSKDVLARLWVARQKDVPCRSHIFICLMHSINDGAAIVTAAREYLQELSSLSKVERIRGPPLVERLAMLLPIEDLGPIPAIGPARRRWRESIAKVILSLRQAKSTGGHTLPTRPRSGSIQAARSRTTVLILPEDVSGRIIRACRTQGVTFGSTLPVLSQLAISRVLHRRRQRCDETGAKLIDDEEWEYRCRQPMHFGGPVNFRPYLNRDWFERGGATEICLAISFYYTVLPSMPTQVPAKSTDYEGADNDDTPSFSALLSTARFFYRARLIQAQVGAQLRDPLFYEIHKAMAPSRVILAKTVGLAWREKAKKGGSGPIDVPSTFNHRPCVFSNGGASLGNRDLFLPYDYPVSNRLDAKDSTRAHLHIVNTNLHLRCRPSELYLGAVQEHRQLRFFSFTDLNTYDESAVQEWLEEIRSAAIHYLGEGIAPKPRF